MRMYIVYMRCLVHDGAPLIYSIAKSALNFYIKLISKKLAIKKSLLMELCLVILSLMDQHGTQKLKIIP